MNPESSIDYVKGESAVPITTRADLLPFPLRIHSLSSTLEHYVGVKSDAKNSSPVIIPPNLVPWLLNRFASIADGFGASDLP